MAFRQIGGSPKKALPGDILLVVHDFEARSPDELTLSKGDRIELIERDDDFGDGWYLGKHTQNSKTGLFPEVYTTTTPKANKVFATTFSSPAFSLAEPITNVQLGKIPQQAGQRPMLAHSTQDVVHGIESSPNNPTPPPLNPTTSSNKISSRQSSVSSSQSIGNTAPVSRSLSMALGNHRGQDEDSPVMNETLSVIDEHITDMNGARSSLRLGERRGTNDSSSEYSSQIDHRLSYIAGNETDEEERNLHTRSEVNAWSPSQVAEGLRSIGVENRHCDVFKEQEISGEVLLGMDQAAVFMKELDLGLVGRRLRTWHKIKALQDEIRSQEQLDDKGLNSFTTDASSDEIETRGSYKPVNVAPLPQAQSNIERPASRPSHSRHNSQHANVAVSPQLAYAHQRGDSRASLASFSVRNGPESPGRPSAASVREINHSRRHSTVDLVSPSTPDNTLGKNLPHTPQRTVTSPHKKTPSLDRNWTMGATTRTTAVRPVSAISMSTDHNTFDPLAKDSGYTLSTSRDLDRGYVSGGEVESRKVRNVLKKRDAASTNHSRNNSSLEENRRASQMGGKRQSRFGSVDSIRDTVAAMTSPASRVYHSASVKGRFRNSSANEMGTTSPMLNTLTSPTVTKLEYGDKPRMSVITSTSKPSSPKPPGDLSSAGSPGSSLASPQAVSKHRVGLRAISDAVTGSEKALVSSPISVPSPAKESGVNSPARTGSTTPSRASEGLDRESTDASSKGTAGTHAGLTSTSGTTRQKRKKETSAYLRGLVRRSPQEQMVGCDYSGWMKKKSSNLMTTWKPRLFVLRGRRLSYFYSESDFQEKGLIDISGHRVLPADNDIITGFHATVTGAKSSPVSPQNAQTPTIASQEAAAQADASTQKEKIDAMFIFKLVPPRAGLSRAVNFTKPTIHYFAVENVVQGRLWMAALMKATIDRDDTKPVKSSYKDKTISLAKARMQRQRPPALMNLDEKSESVDAGAKSDETGLNIQGVDFEEQNAEPDRKRTSSLGVEASSGMQVERPAETDGNA